MDDEYFSAKAGPGPQYNDNSNLYYSLVVTSAILSCNNYFFCEITTASQQSSSSLYYQQLKDQLQQHNYHQYNQFESSCHGI